LEDRRFLLVVSLQDKVTETQAAAARILDAVAAAPPTSATRPCSAPARRSRPTCGASCGIWASHPCYSRRSCRTTAGCGGNVTDEYNVSQHFAYEDRVLLVRGLRRILPLAPESVSVNVLPLPENRLVKVVVVVVVSSPGPLPRPTRAPWPETRSRSPGPTGRWPA
jgi:hypothetical protein